MAGLNKVLLIGHLGKDPEVRYAASGLAIANFNIATSERAGKDKEERTEWHRIVAFDKLAEICGQYLSKGKQVFIEGRIQTRDWEDKEGNKRTTTEIIANNMQMLGSKGSSGGGGNAYTPPPHPGPKEPAAGTGSGPSPADAGGPPPDDDIPF